MKILVLGCFLYLCLFSNWLHAQSCTAAKTYSAFLGADGMIITGAYNYANPYKLVFDDEFNGTGLDATKWATYYYKYLSSDDRTRASYNELQYYDDNNVVVQNGVVKFISERVPTFTYQGISRQYKTGMLYSKKPNGYRFGKFEMRCKLPQSAGGWLGPGYKPAFWLIGGCYGRDEIDIFEMEGRSPNEIVSTIHKQLDCTPTSSGTGSTACYSNQAYTTNNTSVINDFHTYGVEWTPNCITWSIDGVITASHGGWYSSTGANAGCGPYAQAIYKRKALFLENNPLDIVANLQILEGAGDPSQATYPNSMEIDYIRVYQRIPNNAPEDLCSVTLDGPTTACANQATLTYNLTTTQPVVSTYWTTSTNLRIVSSSSTSVTVNSVAAGSGWVNGDVNFGPNSACSVVPARANISLDAGPASGTTTPPVFVSAPKYTCPNSGALMFSVVADCTPIGQGNTFYTWQPGVGLQLLSGQGTPTVRVQPVVGFTGSTSLSATVNRQGYNSSPAITNLQVTPSSLNIITSTLNSTPCSATRRYTAGINVQNINWEVDGISYGSGNYIDVQYSVSETTHTVVVSATGICPTGNLTNRKTNTLKFSSSCAQRTREATLFTYPNPAAETVNIYYGTETVAKPTASQMEPLPAGTTISLYDTQGMERRRLTLNKADTKVVMPVRELPGGLYHLLVTLPTGQKLRQNLEISAR